MNKLKTIDLIAWLFILIMVVSAIYFNGHLPDRVITHWNASGQADGWGSKNFHLIFFPLLTIAIYFLFKFLPKIDPKRRNYEQFDLSYHGFRLAFVIFFVVMFVVTSLVNMGYKINIGMTVGVLIGLLFIFIGLIIKNIKQNWFMGIRTPWTLSSDYVWTKTHIFAQKIFILAGFIFVLLPFLPAKYFGYYILTVVLLIVLGTYGYSYWLYKKEESSKK